MSKEKKNNSCPRLSHVDLKNGCSKDYKKSEKVLIPKDLTDLKITLTLDIPREKLERVLDLIGEINKILDPESK